MTISILSWRSILLLDGIGAAVTAVSVGLVLPALQPFIGMPVFALRLLGGFAVLLGAYSLSRHFTGRISRSVLRRVATANLLYCALTTGLLVWYGDEVRAWGLVYFAGEITIVVALSLRELGLARRGLEERLDMASASGRRMNATSSRSGSPVVPTTTASGRE